MKINLNEIVIPKKRMRSVGDLSWLVESMSKVGLLNPVTLTEDRRLIAGLHRIHAAKKLGWEEIDATVVQLPKLEAQLAEIDENLIRNELKVLERGEHLQRRKEIYETLHPETKNGAMGGGRNGKGGRKKTENEIISFSVDTAKKIGVSGRSIEQEVRIAKAIPEEVKKKIRGTDLEDCKTDLLILAKESEEEQNELVYLVASSEAKTIKEAKKIRRKQRNIQKEKDAANAVTSELPWVATNDQSVIQCDVVMTDPPYGILDESWEPSDIEAFTKGWLTKWNECGAHTFLVFWSQAYLFDGKFWFDECLTKYQFTQLLVWHYPNNKGHQSRSKFKQTWEPVFYYRLRDSEKEIKVRGSEWGEGLTDFDCHISAVPQSNFNGENMKQHPAQKPVEVMRWLVNAATEPGELIADPFMGSGTTGLACCSMGRFFHGIEIGDDYLELAKRRLAAYGDA